MTTAVAEVPVAPRRRRRWPWLVAAALFLATALVGVQLSSDHDNPDVGYGPLQPGDGTALGGAGVVTYQADGLDRHRLGRGGAYFASFVRNTGTHDVRVGSFVRQDAIGTVEWLPAKRQDVSFDARWRSLPATIPSGGLIQVRVTIVRARSCHRRFDGAFRLRWHSRDSIHVYRAPTDSLAEDLELC